MGDSSLLDDGDFKFLLVNKKELMEKAAPYDGKKSVWVNDKKEGFVAGEIIGSKGAEVTVQYRESKQEATVKKDDIHSMNPPKFEMIDDMASLTYLNEASVLHNLRARYTNQFIYTYSGLFCVTINPYKRLPIYTKNVISKYRGKRRNEMPPHLFSIADNAYTDMLQNRENQSMLITGESGAGKTENTKKVISYFASVAASSKGDEKEGAEKKGGSLEDAIIQANPVLEAYGNAKTVRNNNSSRFGKFIRIHFGTTGKIAGADIETYLLEKSRVTYQLPGVERNYHIFYWLLSGEYPDYAEKLLVKLDPAMYQFINQGCLDVDGMDDKEEMRLADEAFAVLGIPPEEKLAMYKTTAAVMLFGEMKFKQRPREEQAEADGSAEAEKVAHLIGVNTTDLLKALLTPKVKVGTEWVTKGQNLGQVNFAVAALAKALYSKMFLWLVHRVNTTLDTKKARQYFIGVLDIAGFEIFEMNTLEQLLINYTNERLQQFFNHHMFVLEQEEYKKEGIQWEFIDFGMDLQDTIDLIEKPMGILSILEEQCMFPKATNETFKSMLYENHHGKSKGFGKPKPNKNAKFEAHFELFHYAGTVGYNIDGWLFKNKDPLNDCVASLMGASKEKMVASFFPTAEEPKGGEKKKRKKGSAYATISATHKEQLHKLVHNLNTTSPHFVRCIIPNERKCPFELDAHLVLHQLQCNGVLEGIRICRKGFPSRMIYSEFKQRYSILAPNAIPQGFVDGKVATGKIIESLQLDQDQYKLGHTKVFFRAGVLGTLEEQREERLSKILSFLQGWCRGFLIRKSYQTLVDQRLALSIVQRNIRRWLTLRTWQWWKLYTRVKPLLSIARQEDEMKAKEKELEDTKVNLEKVEKVKKDLEEQNVTLLQAKNEIFLQLQSEQDQLADAEEKIEHLVSKKFEYESLIKELEERLSDEEGSAEELTAAKKKLTDEVDKYKTEVEDMQIVLKKAEEEKKARDNTIRTLNEERDRQDEQLAKITKEKKGIEENLRKTQDDLAAEEDKCNHLNKLKIKLEGNIDDLEDSLEREKKQKGDMEKAKRKVEQELKMTQETVEELEQAKRSLEDNVRRKETEINSLNSKLEDEQSLVAQLQKKIKELQSRIEELEEELEAERNARAKVEKQRAALNMELEELGERLDEAGGATAAQTELNKKREAELVKLRRDLEESQIQSEQQVAQLKKKSQDAMNELSDQMDQLSKAKNKIEKEKGSLKHELDDLHSQVESATKGKINAEKLVKTLEQQMDDMNSKLDESTGSINDMGAMKARMQAENAELLRQLEEVESQLNQLQRQKQQVSKQLEEAKSTLEDETRAKHKLQTEARNLHADMETLRDQLEEEQEARGDLQRTLQKVQSEAAEWRRKCESGEGGVRSEELEDLKRKLNNKLIDAESELESAQAKINQLEKAKSRLAGELEDVMVEVERAQVIAAQADKRQRQFDKQVDEWREKCDGLERDVERSQAEGRNHSAEIYRLKAQIEEAHDQVEGLRKDNKNLQDEISDLTDQLGEGGKSVHDLDKARRRLMIEKEELQGALEEAEGALEAEEQKVMRSQLEISAMRQEVDRKLAEKEEEFETTRKNHAKLLESMQASLEAESRGKAEAIRAKKKLENDINELEMSADGANRARAEAEKVIKKYQTQLRELQQQIEEEQRAKEEARDHYQTSERRNVMMASELEELRGSLEAAERARKHAESELHEAADRVNELSTQNASLNAHKRRLEGDCQAMQIDLEDLTSEVKSAEDKGKKATLEIGKLNEDMRREQDRVNQVEKVKHNLENTVKDLQLRLEETEGHVLKGGKKQIQKLEQRIRDLEADLDVEQRRYTEVTKSIRKQDRRLKELTFDQEEDKKTIQRLQGDVEGLQNKCKTYKRQVEEAEEVAAINLSKYRKATSELEDAQERADSSEQTLSRLRAKNRSSVSTTRTFGTPGTAIIPSGRNVRATRSRARSSEGRRERAVERERPPPAEEREEENGADE